MPKYLDPKADITFKKVFGEHKDLLKNFLNSVLPLPSDGKIDTLCYLSPELVPTTPKGKDSVVDVRCADKYGRTFIVEMQMYWTDAFKKRALFNTCKAYSYPAERGCQYDSLKSVYTLSLVNDNAFSECPDDFYHIYTLTHHKYNEMKIEDIMLIFIELPKFQKQFCNDKERMSLWLRFLTEINENTKEVSPELKKDRYISKAVSLVEESAYTIEELLSIDRYWDIVSRERTIMAAKFTEGLAEGEAKGHAEGHAEGLAKGLAEGEAKGHAKGFVEGIMKIAKNMKTDNIPMESIVRLTGLTEEEISKL